jgi:hypothetical protein
MSYAQVRAVLGPHQAGEIKLVEQAEACLSWIYDETFDAQFIHATFRGDVLLSANDGNSGTCR